MKKTHINLLLVALSSATVLAACNSGSSPSPAPAPTPSPSPSPSPSPTPAPTPAESGVAALKNVAYSMSYSQAPSTGAFTLYSSGDVATLGSVALGNTNSVAVDVANVKLLVSSSTGGTWTLSSAVAGTSAAQLTKAAGNVAGKIVYGNGVYLVATTVAGQFIISSNADSATPSWTTLTVPAITNTTKAIAYAGNKFVLVDASGAVWTSTNGVTWTNSSVTVPGTAGDVYDITYVNNSYAFIDQTTNIGTIYTTTSLAASNTWNTFGVAAAGYNVTTNLGAAPTSAKFAASGNQLLVVYADSAGGKVLPVTYNVSSTTGVLTAASNNATTSSTGAVVSDVVASNGVNYVTFTAGSGAAQGVASLAAATFTNITNNVPNGVAGFASGIVTTGNAAANNLSYYNGSAVVNLPSGTATIKGFASNGSNYMAIASDGTVIITSSGNWTPATTIKTAGGGAVAPTGLIYAAGKFIATTNSTVAYVSTNNGTSWAPINLPANPGAAGIVGNAGLSYQNNQFVLTSGTNVYTSPDAVTWTTANALNAASGLFGFGNYTYAITSAGGASYQTNTPTISGSWSSSVAFPANIAFTGGFAYNGSVFAGFANGGSSIWTSESATSGTWTTSSATYSPITISGTTYTATAFAASAGYSGLVWTGKTWAALANVANSQNGVYTSTAGTQWATTANGFDTTGTNYVSLVQF